MADENTKSDIEFVKGYLQSCIELETQKRLAKKTFNELTQEENKWKEKISYKAKKQYTSFSVIDMLVMAAKGVGISTVILLVMCMFSEVLPEDNFFVDLVPLIWLIAKFILVIVLPVYKKVADYNAIKDNFILEQQKEVEIKQEGKKALYVIQDNKEKLKQAYTCAMANLTNVYGANIIYKKYQTVEACSSMYDYLESGRCYTLEGPHGAYNKYDDELSKGMIIERLEEINSKMDVVISNQVKAYHVMQNIEKNVSEMKSEINFICNSLQEVDEKLNDIANNTKITAWASSVVATRVPDWKYEAQKKANKMYV